MTARDSESGVAEMSLAGGATALAGIRPRGLVQFKDIDLTNVRKLDLMVDDFVDLWAGGRIEVIVDDMLSPPVGATMFEPQSPVSTTVAVPVTIAPTPGVHDLYIYLRGLKGTKKGTIALSEIRLGR